MKNNDLKKRISNCITSFFTEGKPLHPYRVFDISQNKKGDYYITIQVVGKHRFFKMKPEEILANDAMTLQFSQLDIRTLTYLGYLGINSPKYKVLAKHLCTQDGVTFSIYSKENDTVELKKASEILSDQELWKNLDRDDMPEVAYSAGGDRILKEKEEIRQLKEAKRKLNNN